MSKAPSEGVEAGCTWEVLTRRGMRGLSRFSLQGWVENAAVHTPCLPNCLPNYQINEGCMTVVCVCVCVDTMYHPA